MATRRRDWVGAPVLGASGLPSDTVQAGDSFLIVIATDRLPSAEGNRCILSCSNGADAGGLEPLTRDSERIAHAQMFPEQGYSTYHIRVALNAEHGVKEKLEGAGCNSSDGSLLVGPYNLTFIVLCKEPVGGYEHEASVDVTLMKRISREQLRGMSAWKNFTRNQNGS